MARCHLGRSPCRRLRHAAHFPHRCLAQARAGALRQVSCQAVAKSGRRKVKEDASPPPQEEQPAVDQLTDLAAAPYQQTLNRSFTLAGVGLHTGEYACVRVRPAFAGDGKYFVRVPEGTNRHLVDAQASAREQAVLEAEKGDPDIRDKQMAVYMQFVRAQEDGYQGAFEDYVLDAGAEDFVAGTSVPPLSDETEEPVAKDVEDPAVVEAHVGNLAGLSPYCTVLGTSDANAVGSVEHLLAALEGLHVDNARIEIEGGSEVPVCDGSAQAWVESIADVGIRPAVREKPEEGEEEGEPVRKHSWRPTVPISVFDHESFITLYPAGVEHKLSVGVQRDCRAIGQQWITFDPQGCSTPDVNFAFDVAPARTWVESTEVAYAMRNAGFLRAGTIGCTLVANGDDWLASADVRFMADEPCRHNIIDIMGDLALLGLDGNSGLPCGHLVAFNADHELQQEFVRRMAEAISEGEVQQFPFMLTGEEVLALHEMQEAEAAKEAEEAEKAQEAEEAEATEEAETTREQGEQEGTADKGPEDQDPEVGAQPGPGE